MATTTSTSLKPLPRASARVSLAERSPSAFEADENGSPVSLEEVDWLVCFVPGLKRQWWHRFVSGYQHVFAIRCVDKDRWPLFEPWWSRLLASHYATLIDGEVHRVFDQVTSLVATREIDGRLQLIFLAGRVLSAPRQPRLAARALAMLRKKKTALTSSTVRTLLEALSINCVHCVIGPGTSSWPTSAPTLSMSFFADSRRRALDSIAQLSRIKRLSANRSRIFAVRLPALRGRRPRSAMPPGLCRCWHGSRHRTPPCSRG